MNKLKHTILVLCCFIFPTFCIAQDCMPLAIAPDVKPRTIDSLALRHLITKEKSDLLMLELYPEWSNKYTHKTFELPQTYKIDLQHFCMPTTSTKITSKFGPRWNRQHKGLDIKVYVGDTIKSAFEGKVRIVKYDARGYGYFIVIRHLNGLETVYGHLSKQLVKENQVVKCGDAIGLGGNSGRSTGSHLHFETRFCGVALNPELLFDFVNQDVTNDFYMFTKSSLSNDYDFAQFYKVQSGDTLYTVAKKMNISVKELCSINHLSTGYHLKPGQLLKCTK